MSTSTTRDALIIAEDILRRLKNGDKTVTESQVTAALTAVREAQAAKAEDFDPRVFPSVESFPVDDRGVRTIDLFAAFALQGILSNSRFTKSAAFNPKHAASRAKAAAAALLTEMQSTATVAEPVIAAVLKTKK